MKVRVAITGMGYISAVHARAAYTSEEAKLVAVVSRHPVASQAFADQFGAKRILTAWRRCWRKAVWMRS